MREAQVSAPVNALAWLGLAWLGLAWLGLAWLGLAWLGEIQFGRSKLSVTHQERNSAKLHQDGRHDARLPDHETSWTGRNTAHSDVLQLHSAPVAVSSMPPQNLRPVNRASSGTPSPAAARTSLLDTAPLFYNTAIIHHQQTKTKSRQVSRNQTNPDCTPNL